MQIALVTYPGLTAPDVVGPYEVLRMLPGAEMRFVWHEPGATVGDFLDKPVAEGGLDLSRPVASAVLAAIIIVLLIVLPQRPGQHPGHDDPSPPSDDATSTVGRRSAAS